MWDLTARWHWCVARSSVPSRVDATLGYGCEVRAVRLSWAAGSGVEVLVGIAAVKSWDRLNGSEALVLLLVLHGPLGVAAYC